MRTDRHEETNGRFSQFCESAKKPQTIQPLPLPRSKPSISRASNLINQKFRHVVLFKRAQNNFSWGKAAVGVKLVIHIRLRLDLHFMALNPLRSKSISFYLKTQFVPRSEHLSSRL